MESIAVLSPRVTRILGQNPGPFTLQGTNTYLVAPQASSSSSNAILPTILVDTGDGEEAYIPLLERTLRGAGLSAASSKDGHIPAGRRYITEIALSHRHHDHVDGLPSVLALLSRLRSDSEFSSTPLPLPRLHKKPDAKHDPDLVEVLRGLPADSFEPYRTEPNSEPSPLWPLKHDDVLSTHREGSSLQVTERANLRVVESPGHTADHLCFLLQEERTLFTADHVLGQGTTVFEDLTAYIDSLTRCSALLQQTGPSVFHSDVENRLYPGHGPVVERGRFILKQYADHRREREKQILELLETPSPTRSHSADGSPEWSLQEIVSELYAGFPENVLQAATRGIFLHVHRLATNDWPKSVGRVKCLRYPEYAQAILGNPPRVPENWEEWGQVGSSRWSLIKRAAF
ncbi:unnamed protein product [Tilletia controversa]|uniref:Metallo-beta-lactamase domain-containing protein n=3 Tax=Tilletia TaxID=13289 RepID=A0A8X7MVM8_9BASI|nr:hypothetical protein CF336_g2185 [Tilletia laevis]KAE8202640.1 hypothetical protein CF328_g2103 [Tilletia controversa]KAE8263440.1 hypothetical protein A4X03_0g1676 [Tilletia caries]KAE8206968.1 hypothetical protein CF335_g1487 [Tilletia laevis]KAE8251742.1 hypothetical protein A4X06_0g2549 [Tilletia controversa]